MSVRLRSWEEGACSVVGTDLIVLAHFADWAIYRKSESEPPIARFRLLRECRAYLNDHPELLEGEAL